MCFALRDMWLLGFFKATGIMAWSLVIGLCGLTLAFVDTDVDTTPTNIPPRNHVISPALDDSHETHFSLSL